MALNSIWNRKIEGVLPAMGIGLSILFNRIANVVSSFGFCHNIASCGKNVRVNRHIIYRYPARIYVGNEVILGTGISLSSENIPCSKLQIGNNVSIGDRCDIDFSGGITIEDGAHLAHNVRIISHDHGYNYKNEPVGRSLTIERNVFVGSDVVILFNCNKIGSNAVIGAGSVVTKDVPANAIVGGNPARIIKIRENL